MDEYFSTCNDTFNDSYQPNEWLDFAVNYLCSTGWTEEFKLERLAEYSNKPIEDFYKFYRDFNHLLEDLLRYYHQRHHRYYLEMLQKSEGSVRDKLLLSFTRFINRNDIEFEIAMRNWARAKDDIHLFLKRLDKQKINCLTKVFVQDGFTEEDAESRASLIYWSYIGKLEHIRINTSKEKKMENFLRILDILVRKFDE